MSGRLATICLHWTNLVLLLMLMAAGSASSALAWALLVSGLSMMHFALAGVIMNGSEPKLEGGLRKEQPWPSQFTHVLLVGRAIATLCARRSLPTAGTGAQQAQLPLPGVRLLHGCYHLWRASALNDDALRRMRR